MRIEKELFGKTKNGQDVYAYTLENDNGMSVKLMEYGATLMSIKLLLGDGAHSEMTLGFDTLAQYEEGDAFYGAVIGRVANRIENSTIELDGNIYHLYNNEGVNCLHGGKIGFDKKVWASQTTASGVRFAYLSRDGEENFPGELNVITEYTLTDDNELRINYKAVTDKTTMVSLTNHAYFNLSDKTQDSMMKHKLRLNADRFTIINDQFIPTGVVSSVSATPFDFRQFKAIGEDIECDDIQLKFAGGYDHNFIVNRPLGNDALMYTATLRNDESGVEMNVYTTMPGVQFYSGNNIKGGTIRDDGTEYERRCGICLETQFFPNAQKFPAFSQPILEPGKLYDHTTVFAFKKLFY